MGGESEFFKDNWVAKFAWVEAIVGSDGNVHMVSVGCAHRWKGEISF